MRLKLLFFNLRHVSTTGHPEKLKKVVEDNTPQVLELVNRNRKSGLEALQKRLEGLEKDLETSNLSDNLENTLRDVKAALSGTLVSLEAQNSLLDMLCHDVGAGVYNLQVTQKALQVSNRHLQNLLDLLKNKEVITENELKENWDQLIEQKTAEVEKELAANSQPQVVDNPSEG